MGEIRLCCNPSLLWCPLHCPPGLWAACCSSKCQFSKIGRESKMELSILMDTDTWWRSEEEQMPSYWTALDWDFCGRVRIGLDSQRIWSICRIAKCFTGSTTSDRKPSLRSKLLMAHKRPLFQGKSEENDGQYRITNYTCIWWSTLYFQLHLWLAFVWRGRREEESLCFEMTLSLCFALPALQVACLAAWHKFAK